MGIRRAAKKRLHDLFLELTLQDVEVIDSWDATPERDHVRVGAVTTGTMSVPTAKTGRKHYDDRFVVHSFILAATPGRSAEEAQDRWEEIFGAVRLVVAEHSKLELNGQRLKVTDPTTGEAMSVVEATLGEVDGPDAHPLDTEGYLADGRFVVNIHARLT